MKKTLKYSLLALVSLLWACDELKDVPRSYTYTSYVYKYICPDTLYLQQSPLKTITVVFKGREINRYSALEQYNAIGEKHNDMSYNKTMSNYKPVFPHVYLAVDLVSVIVTSNADFDAEHPAGTPLNNLIQFTAYSPYNYIQRGYAGEPEKEKIDKVLSECTVHDFLMTIARDEDYYNYNLESCNLQFAQAPTLEKEHTITVTTVDDSGNTWQASIDMNWSEENSM